MSLKQASAELDALRAEFSNLPKEKRYAFRAKFQAYLDTKSEEDKRVVAKAFLQGFEEAIDEGKGQPPEGRGPLAAGVKRPNYLASAC